jgi:large subunit ribosomal protein L25
MNSMILQATAREKQPGRFQEVGFVQGVIYGKTIATSSVKFDEAVLNKIVSATGIHSNVTVEFAGVTMKGFIKDLQRAVMGQEISHVDIQILG